MAAELSEDAVAAARRSLNSAFSSGAEAGKGPSVVDSGDDSDSDDDDDDEEEEQGGTKEEALIGVIFLSRLFALFIFFSLFAVSIVYS